MALLHILPIYNGVSLTREQVFDSANLSLAFEGVRGGGCDDQTCNRQKALASVLLIALIAWLLTFSISVMR